MATVLKRAVDYIAQESRFGKLQINPGDLYAVDNVRNRIVSIERIVNGVTHRLDVAEPAKATGATAGTPGSFTPPGASTPANINDMSGVTASPATAWTTGQYIVMGNLKDAYWNGTAWTADRAP